MWFGMHTAGGWGWLGIVFWVLLLVGIIFLVIWLITRASGSRETPMDILKKRYARGEISKEEYQRMKKELTE